MVSLLRPKPRDGRISPASRRPDVGQPCSRRLLGLQRCCPDPVSSAPSTQPASTPPAIQLTNNNSCQTQFKKKHLMPLFQVVDDQYNRCLEEIHKVVSAFHAVTKGDPNLQARFALPKISAMYRNLRERISSHSLAMGAAQHVKDESSIQKRWALQQLKKRDHQLWRPPREIRLRVEGVDVPELSAPVS